MFIKYSLSSIYETKKGCPFNSYLQPHMLNTGNNPSIKIGSFANLQNYKFHDSASKFEAWCAANKELANTFVFTKEFFVDGNLGKHLVARNGEKLVVFNTKTQNWENHKTKDQK